MNTAYLKFKRPSNTCLVCGTNLEKADRHATILNLSETEEAMRRDICPKCWVEMAKPDYFSFWVTKRYQEGLTTEERKLAKSERNQALWALFNVLYTQHNDKDSAEDLRPHLFLTAHLLMKYRVVQFIRTEDGNLVFLHPQSDSEFSVPDVPLDSVSFVDINENVESQLINYAPDKPDPEMEDQMEESEPTDSAN